MDSDRDALNDLAGMGSLSLLAQVLDPVQAYILQGRLQAEGIPVFVADGQLVQGLVNAILVAALPPKIVSGKAEAARP